MEATPVSRDEIQTLLALMRALQDDDPWSVPFEDARAKEAVQLLLANESYGRIWFIRDAGRIVGYIVMSFDYSLEYGGRNAWVDEFFIEKESRGKGLGAQALDFFEQQARQAGATAIHLEVNHGNKAIDLYRRRGFTDHHRYLMTKLLR
jgi:diamine N-acetyltransferase